MLVQKIKETKKYHKSHTHVVQDEINALNLFLGRTTTTLWTKLSETVYAIDFSYVFYDTCQPGLEVEELCMPPANSLAQNKKLLSDWIAHKDELNEKKNEKSRDTHEKMNEMRQVPLHC